MLSIKKYAAIDIGSNGVRLLITNIIEQKGKPTQFKKNSLTRVPIRLGADVFVNNKISKENIQRLLDTMQAFKLLMKSHKVVKYKACATSAMRESTNGAQIVDLILEQTGIPINVITEEDAASITATDLDQYIDPNKTYLYVDVGGGNTEFTIIYKGEAVVSKSFKIGTVRLLNDRVKTEAWQQLREWIASNALGYDGISVIGSGGIINKIFKLSGKTIGKPLTYFHMSSFYNLLQGYSYEARITELDLTEDRADVIIPAMQIYLSAMKWSGAENIYVPEIGLADGIIKSTYYDTVSSNTQ